MKDNLTAEEVSEHYNIPVDAIKVIAPAIITEVDGENLLVECRVDSINLVDTVSDEAKMVAIFSFFKKLLKEGVEPEHMSQFNVKGYFYLEVPEKLLSQEVVEGGRHGNGMYYHVSSKESKITASGGIAKTVDIKGGKEELEEERDGD